MVVGGKLRLRLAMERARKKEEEERRRSFLVGRGLGWCKKK